ncbi:reprolysin-like metallopeptidase [Cognaticolwellia mytili]|uniref:reprolysin-like metallopeptidase n=1 Tax=Cognaticolwellia mytili TaxID=1888913 RepID=UPI000A16DD99|nr:zinc-dependent metalloprotease family protein [Cognaticolwellia mytili]
MIKSKLFIGFCFFIGALNIAQANGYSKVAIDKQFWQTSHAMELAQNFSSQINSKATSGLYFDVNITLLEQQLLNNDTIQLDLPLPDGSYVKFELTASQVMHPELAEKYPSIRTFSGRQVGNANNIGQFDITPQGFHGVFGQGIELVFIDPSSRSSNSKYHNYYRKDAEPIVATELSKRLPPRKQATKNYQSKQVSTSSAKTTTLTTYKLAIATTGEYAAFHGGTKESTLAALVTLVNRLNDVYQRDLSIKFELVASNDSIIFTDSNTDPFDNTDDDIDVNSDVINAAIGAENYDIGHLVGTGGGGLAGFEVICTSIKAEGVTGSARPTSDSFYIDYVAHEIGHQFGADHTFNGGQGACDGNRVSTSAYEPGSASTIMGYAGICEGQNIQGNSEPYFHIHSIDQIRNFASRLSSCGTTSNLANDAPTVDAGINRTIPANTPFTLIGTAIDPDGDSLNYSWEQHDLGAQSNNATEDAIDDGKRPLFRTFSPKNSAERTLPKLADILANKTSYGEALPSVTRELNFRLVVRDNQNNLVDDAMTINVIGNEQGFSISDIANWNGSTQTVSWHTADSEKVPVSCAAVDILLSTDSGISFNQTLANDVNNDGSHTISLPNLITTTARVKIACSDNIFFTINNADFEISSTDVAPTKPIFTGQDSISINEDASILLSTASLNFENNPTIDSLAITAGENYSFDGLTVTPMLNFNGNIKVNMTATASNLLSDPFQVSIDINAVNDLPTAVADSATVAQDSSNNEIDVLVNDSDIDGQTITIKVVSASGNGIATIVNDKVNYTPASGFSGTETIRYTIEDSEGGSANAEVSITVTATPVTPTPVAPPTTEPTKSSSGGGSVYYLLMLLVVALRQTITKGSRNV